MDLPDIQNESIDNGAEIDQVGIESYHLPYEVYMKDGGTQSTVASISMYTTLSKEVRGANISRFSQTLTKALQHKQVSIGFIIEVLYVLRDRLESHSSFIVLDFPYFILRKSPVTDNYSYSRYDCQFKGSLKKDVLDIQLAVKVPYTSLCPCSKAMSISVGGAHNQRSEGELVVHLVAPQQQIVWIEDLVQIVESVASCPIYNTLKREDEKWVTEKAYSNPKFVEDVARDIGEIMKSIEGVDGWKFTARHFESIHQYSAISIIRGSKFYIE